MINTTFVGGILWLGIWAWMRWSRYPESGNDFWHKLVARSGLIGGGICAFLGAGGANALGGNQPVSNVVCALIVPWCVGWLFGLLFDALGWGQGDSGGDSHRRGAWLATAKDVEKMIPNQEKTDLKLAGVSVPRHIENRHFLLCGTTGSGKSFAIIGLLDVIGRRGIEEKLVIADSGGEYLSRYFQAGDAVINPFDERCAPWSPFAEMRGPWDAEMIAKSIIPTGEGNSAEWNSYGQQFLSALLLRLSEAGGEHATNREFLRLATTASLDELREIVEGLPAASLLAEGNERMFGSIRAIVGSKVGTLAYLPGNAGADGFSIRRYIEEAGSGRLFLSYKDDQLRALAPLIGTLLDVAAVATLSLKPDERRRIWLVADELDSLGTVDGLIPFLTKARKAGGCGVLGIQSMAQMEERYGKTGAVTALNCCGSWLVLKSPEPDTSEFISKFIGEQEVRRVMDSGSAQGKGWSEQITTQRVVMPSEIQGLAILAGYLSFADKYPTCSVTVSVPSRKQGVVEAFIAKPQAASTRPAFVLRKEAAAAAAAGAAASFDVPVQTPAGKAPAPEPTAAQKQAQQQAEHDDLLGVLGIAIGTAVLVEAVEEHKAHACSGLDDSHQHDPAESDDLNLDF